MLGPTVEKRIERKIATPRVPPIWRKKVAEAVATPISVGGTALWTVSSSGCMHEPSPSPRTNIETLTSGSGVSAVVKESRNRPTTITAEPMIGNSRT